jgi:hypothetical protein
MCDIPYIVTAVTLGKLGKGMKNHRSKSTQKRASQCKHHLETVDNRQGSHLETTPKFGNGNTNL